MQFVRFEVCKTISILFTEECERINVPIHPDQDMALLDRHGLDSYAPAGTRLAFNDDQYLAALVTDTHPLVDDDDYITTGVFSGVEWAVYGHTDDGEAVKLSHGNHKEGIEQICAALTALLPA